MNGMKSLRGSGLPEDGLILELNGQWSVVSSQLSVVRGQYNIGINSLNPEDYRPETVELNPEDLNWSSEHIVF